MQSMEFELRNLVKACFKKKSKSAGMKLSAEVPGLVPHTEGAKQAADSCKAPIKGKGQREAQAGCPGNSPGVPEHRASGHSRKLPLPRQSHSLGAAPAQPSSASVSRSSRPFRFSAVMIVGRGARSTSCRRGRARRGSPGLLSLLKGEGYRGLGRSRQRPCLCPPSSLHRGPGLTHPARSSGTA